MSWGHGNKSALSKPLSLNRAALMAYQVRLSVAVSFIGFVVSAALIPSQNTPSRFVTTTTVHASWMLSHSHGFGLLCVN